MIANGYNWDGSTSGNKIAKSLAATTDWNSSGTKGNVGNDIASNNRTGFTALTGGYRNYAGNYLSLGHDGTWWSSTENTASRAYYRGLYYTNPDLVRYDLNKEYGFSVRFLKD